MTFRELVGARLDAYALKEMTEVSQVNEDGRRVADVGIFEDASIARVFIQQRPDPGYHAIAPVFVLTDGNHTFKVTGESVGLSDAMTRAKLRDQLIAKLSPDERALLGV